MIVGAPEPPGRCTMPLNHGFTYRTQVGPEAAGRTLLDHLAATYTHSSRAEWTSRCDRGEVALDGGHATGYETLRAGQRILWHRPPWFEPVVPTGFDILHEDAALVAVHKPAGLPSMPAGGFLEQTLLRRVQGRWPEAHAVHRLGRHTSGVVVFARTPEAASRLSADWRAARVRKVYRALVSGEAAWGVQDIRVPIGPVPHARLGSVFAASPGGKTAHSVARVLGVRHGTSILEVEITTGRPHQIRIHLAAIGHPLVGDPLYAPGGGPRLAAPGLPGDGGYLLHAARVELTHPVSGARISIEAPVPEALCASDRPV